MSCFCLISGHSSSFIISAHKLFLKLEIAGGGHLFSLQGKSHEHGVLFGLAITSNVMGHQTWSVLFLEFERPWISSILMILLLSLHRLLPFCDLSLLPVMVNFMHQPEWARECPDTW